MTIKVSNANTQNYKEYIELAKCLKVMKRYSNLILLLLGT